MNHIIKHMHPVGALKRASLRLKNLGFWRKSHMMWVQNPRLPPVAPIL
jgi:hypothetical protein